MRRVGFSCLLLKRRGLATGSRFCGDWLLHHMPWSSLMQTALDIRIYRHSIRPLSCPHLAQHEGKLASHILSILDGRRVALRLERLSGSAN